jgi:hypothetical protein
MARQPAPGGTQADSAFLEGKPQRLGLSEHPNQRIGIGHLDKGIGWPPNSKGGERREGHIEAQGEPTQAL